MGIRTLLQLSNERIDGVMEECAKVLPSKSRFAKTISAIPNVYSRLL